MKKLSLFILLVITGCSVTTGERKPDGTLAVHNYRLLWASEGINFTTASSNGFTATLSVQKSNPDAQSIGAVAEGITKGLAASVKP